MKIEHAQKDLYEKLYSRITMIATKYPMFEYDLF